jgi:hypothetical protein
MKNPLASWLVPSLLRHHGMLIMCRPLRSFTMLHVGVDDDRMQQRRSTPGRGTPIGKKGLSSRASSNHNSYGAA